MMVRELIVAASIGDQIAAGLTARPKSLPSKLFYDAAGSALFEQITRLPEYYLTRAELEIMRARSDEIARAVSAGVMFFELGAGTAAKTCTLLRALSRNGRRVSYFPVDISPSALDQAIERVRMDCPGVQAQSLSVDFTEELDFIGIQAGQKLVAYLGSSIGNFGPEEAIHLLRRIREQLQAGDFLLLGTDLAKDPAILLPAYDDRLGVTAEFNRNILRRINREFAADFDADSFRHVAGWNADESRIEMHLESARHQKVSIRRLPLTIEVQEGERIHTENSYKFTPSMVHRILSGAGFTLLNTWHDAKDWYALHLARV